MPHANERFSTMLTRYLKRHGDAPGDDVSLAVGRVWRRLEPHALHVPARLPRRATPTYAVRVTVAAVAAAAVFVLAATPLIREWTSTDAARAVVDSADGSVYRTASGEPTKIPVGGSINTGETIRTNGNAGAVLALADGSRVEMRSQSELALERADDGIRIRLRSGSIIVNAAKQRTGHLYVQTKDMSVSVVGTIFLVNAEKEGSRVAVIEGEVRVHEAKGTIDTRLRPGEQVSTNPALVTRPVKEEIAWSRNVVAHLSILEAFTKGMAATAGPLAPIAKVVDPAAAASPQNGAAGATREFEEASIRPCDPDNLPPTPAGARGGGPNSMQMTPGRLHALCLTLATILRHAYGYGPVDLEFLNPGGRGPGLQLNNIYGLGVENGKRVRGGPDWVRTEHYTIDAVAADAADAASMSGPMLRSLLENRFRLKTHIETEQIPAWTLTIASGGLKIKPVKADDGAGCDAPPTVAPSQPRLVRAAQPGERQPPLPAPGQMVTILFRNVIDVRRGEKPTCGMSMQRNGPNQVIVAGGTTLEALARSLASPLGGVIVTDKTGNTDKFNIILEFVRDENTPGPSFLAPNQPEPPSNEPRGQTIFAALEEQLGLKLEPATAPRQFIVIDQVERLTPN
jgi:uncharacterized protein (TIGR03435 family)